MSMVLIVLGLLLAVVGLAVIFAGAPDWALGLALGSAMIESGAIGFVGGLLLFGLGLVLRELRELGQRLEAYAPQLPEERVPADVEPEVEPSIVPPEVPIPLSHPLRPAAQVSTRRAPAEEPELRARAWPPYTTRSAAAESATRRAESVAEAIEPPPLESATVSATQPGKQDVEEEPAGTVIRSGIIGGMAYSLYADGSIEAELPIGTMRFASLEELRQHVARTGTEADVEFGGPAQKQ
jgi:hypothetical protein